MANHPGDNGLMGMFIRWAVVAIVLAAWVLTVQALYGDWSCTFKNCIYVMEKKND